MIYQVGDELNIDDCVKITLDKGGNYYSRSLWVIIAYVDEDNIYGCVDKHNKALWDHEEGDIIVFQLEDIIPGCYRNVYINK